MEFLDVDATLASLALGITNNPAGHLPLGPTNSFAAADAFEMLQPIFSDEAPTSDVGSIGLPLEVELQNSLSLDGLLAGDLSRLSHERLGTDLAQLDPWITLDEGAFSYPLPRPEDSSAKDLGIVIRDEPKIASHDAHDTAILAINASHSNDIDGLEVAGRDVAVSGNPSVASGDHFVGDNYFASDGSMPTSRILDFEASETSGETIVVTGKRTPSGGLVWGITGDPTTPPDPVEGNDESIEPPSTEPPPPDETVIEIKINIDRPLTNSEKAALENLKTTIAAIDSAIRSLADNSVLRLANGATVTGEYLKTLWSKTDFEINDNHVAYDNNSYRGEANMINNDPTISFNIGGGLDDYDNRLGGMNYLVAHEIGHLTQWGTPLVYDQVTANDISRALLNGAGLPYLETSDPNFYTATAPMSFSVPS